MCLADAFPGRDIEPGKAFLQEDIELFPGIAVAVLAKWREQQYLISGITGGDGGYHIVGVVLFYATAGDGGIGLPYPCEEQAEIVIDLGHAADRGPWGTGDHFLFYGDSRAESFYIVHI